MRSPRVVRASCYQMLPFLGWQWGQKPSDSAPKKRLRIVPSRTWSAIRSPVEPYILHAPAVEDTVIHEDQPLEPGLPAGSLAHEEDDRADLSLGVNRSMLCRNFVWI